MLWILNLFYFLTSANLSNICYWNLDCIYFILILQYNNLEI